MTLSKVQIEQRRLAISVPEFDAKLMRSVLALYNYCHASSDGSSRPETVGELCLREFGWLAGVLRFRAIAANVDPARLVWDNYESALDFRDLSSALIFFIGPFRQAAGEAPVVTVDGERRTSDQWLNRIFSKLEIHTTLVAGPTGVEEKQVPGLTGMMAAVGYGIALMKMDKHGFASRVRPCQYLMVDTPGSLAHHWFLSDDARMQFCCEQHSNRHRQRLYRRSLAKPRKPK